MSAQKKLRCAIYTRKSSEEGLEQDFNSLDAQREACTAYIASQKHEGWRLVPKPYDDGGISGGTLDRPGLQELIADIEAGKVDQIIVYKIDRLTRSLTDFAKLIERLDAAGASFVSVTQSFNTSTSMGRLTLNVLLSFAQFEREVTAERIRDKIAASKRKGLWMGGVVPIGYEANGRTLEIVESEAKVVRQLYDLYLKSQNIRLVKERADRLGIKSAIRKSSKGICKGGQSMTRGQIHHILTNPIYAGLIRHKDQTFEGEHPAIIPKVLWDEVQQTLQDGAARTRQVTKATSSSLPLTGKLFDENGHKLTSSHAKKGTKRYRYYVSSDLAKQSIDHRDNGWRLPAKQIEDTVLSILINYVKVTDFLTGAGDTLTAIEVRDHLTAKSAIIEDIGAPGTPDWADLIDRVDLKVGELKLIINPQKLADRLLLKESELQGAQLTVSKQVQLKRRGVETRFVIEGQPLKSNKDQTLISAILTARRHYLMIKDGTSIVGLAKTEGGSAKRIRQTIKLAFLAPDIVQDILNGHQSETLTTDWLVRTNLPMDWDEQRQLIAAL